MPFNTNTQPLCAVANCGGNATKFSHYIKKWVCEYHFNHYKELKAVSSRKLYQCKHMQRQLHTNVDNLSTIQGQGPFITAEPGVGPPVVQQGTSIREVNRSMISYGGQPPVVYHQGHAHGYGGVPYQEYAVPDVNAPRGYMPEPPQ